MSKATQENITRLLTLTGATQQELARIAGVDRSAVGHWKSGKAEPRMGHLQKIADHYGISTSNLADPRGMAYVRRGTDGKLHDDNAKRIGDLKQAVISIDDDSSLEDIIQMALSVCQATMGSSRLTTEERELVDMFRAINADGKRIATEVLSALMRSGSYSR